MKQLRTFTILTAAILLLCSNCCDDCPTCPDESDDKQQHYKMYVSAWDNDAGRAMLLSIDIPADTIIDSVTLTAEQHKLAADAASTFYSLFTLTPDNKRILVSGNLILKTTLVFNTSDLSYDTTLDFYGEFHFDRIRNIGLVNMIDGLFKFSPDNFQFTDSLSKQFAYSQLDTANGIIYLTGPLVGEDFSTVYRVDYLTMSLIDSVLIRDYLGNMIVIYEMLPIPEYGRLYFYGSVGGPSYSFIYDLQNERMVSSTLHTTPFGNFVRSANGQTVYMSDPGNEFLDIRGSYLIWIYSVPDDQVTGAYSTLTSDTLGTRFLDIQDMLLTPDGRYLYGGCGLKSGLLRYDLETGASSNVFSKFYPLLPGAIAVGEKMK